MTAAPSGTSPLIRLRGVTKRYGSGSTEFLALKGIDLGRFVPDDPDERAERLAKLRRVGVGVVGALVVCLVIYTVFPVRTAVNLFDAEDRARERAGMAPKPGGFIRNYIEGVFFPAGHQTEAMIVAGAANGRFGECACARKQA